MGTRDDRRGRIFVAALLASVVLLITHKPAAAQIFTTEPFNANLNGWSNNAPGATHNWAWNAGTARGIFGADPVPTSTLILRATTNASGGAFVGNYLAADVTLLGFDFRAENLNPSFIKVELYRGTNQIEAWFTDFAPTGVWNRFAVSLAGRSVGGWLTENDSDAEFDHVLAAVSEVRLYLQRGGVVPFNVTNRIDNVFISRLHQSGGIDAAGDDAALVWGELRTGRVYRIEATTNLLGGGWSTVTTFTATNPVLTLAVSALTNHPIRLFRLVLE